MKLLRTYFIVMSTIFMAQSTLAETTINDADKFAYGANIGWVNWQGDTNNGAVIGQFYCTGYIYSANAGWICLGNGPTNGYQYSNASADDWGVNHDGEGNLGGFAYGANIGWINFEANGGPHVDLLTGEFGGSCYGANVGWISLSNAFAHVKTDTLDPGPDSDSDGIADAWEYDEVGNLGLLSNTNDNDGDGMNDDEEYRADSDPDDINEFLQITEYQLVDSDTNALVEWTSEAARIYKLEKSTSALDNATWVDAGYGPAVGNLNSSTGTAMNIQTDQYIRVKAILPLSP